MDRPPTRARTRGFRLVGTPHVETLAGVPRPLTGVAGLCATLLIAVAGGAAVPPSVAHGAAGPGRRAPGDPRRAREPCARADGVGTDPGRGTPRPRARRADDAGAAGRSGGRGRLPRDRIAGPAGAPAAPRRRRPGRREHHLERADPGRQRVGATGGPGPWLPGVHRGRPGGRHGRAGARRRDPVPGVHVCRCGARPRTDRPRGGRGREGDARPGVHLGAGSGGGRDEGTCRPGDRHPVRRPATHGWPPSRSWRPGRGSRRRA